MSFTAATRVPFPASQHKAQRNHTKLGVLLALDGTRLTPELLAAALKQCVQSTDRLDILLVNPPKAPTCLLGSLLLRLEHSGIDYRLTSGDGDLGKEIVHYLKRFQGIALVIVDSLPSLEQALGSILSDLCRSGYRFIGLSAQNSRAS